MNTNEQLYKDRIHRGMFNIARHLWAIMLIVAEMLTGEKPNWRRDRVD